MMPTPTITNVVTTATTPNRFDLYEICLQYPEAKNRPQLFPGFCLHLTRSKTATLIFSSNEIISVSTPNYRSLRSLLGASYVVKDYTGQGWNVKVEREQTENGD